MMRSLADRLEAVNRTLLPSAAGHPAETAWPMTHLVAIAADASDEVLFRTADPGADRAALAAFAAAVAGTAQALAVVADSAHRLLTAPPAAASPAEASHAHSVARALVTTTARELSSAADRVSTGPVAAVTDLSSHRGAQAGAALARSRVVSVRPAGPDSRGDAAPTAPVIPLRRNR
ncbi:hypothetical protein [Kitasatospora purpeofusca]|uniref:hypothetical protein n=1 Tax=Kitasatospora purpeofusca TaxID=67352 RepID=UPI00224E38E9|nr:hypothetical protein [Kitasatospora purpeofusca]MCX4758769.1 hypothetical protein [Kitasatospora purpeofusca]WSR30801.1 hypothetical protein OG715_07345 [Kitasatospora purpeofusca]